MLLTGIKGKGEAICFGHAVSIEISCAILLNKECLCVFYLLSVRHTSMTLLRLGHIVYINVVQCSVSTASTLKYMYMENEVHSKYVRNLPKKEI